MRLEELAANDFHEFYRSVAAALRRTAERIEREEVTLITVGQLFIAENRYELTVVFEEHTK